MKDGARQPTFVDTNQKQVGGWLAINLAADQGWTDYSLTLDIPAGAVALDVACGIWGASGTVDFDDISVITSPKMLAAGERLSWTDRVEETSRTRSRLHLSGDWLFKEAGADQAERPTGGWGVRAVPGNHYRYYRW